ncbi:hypothetical protein A6S26_05380 [Nostoc sp. ATCC 43529]|nr:hypothetical protein A6S26_05380 [Nostoc sp. ATCC 43529]
MITNKNRMPDVDFLPDDEIRPIGNIGGTRLVLLGKEKGTDVAVVSRSYASEFDPKEDFFAIPLYELISHSQERIELKEAL